MLDKNLSIQLSSWNFKRLIFDYNMQKQLKAVGVAVIDHEKYNETGQWVNQSCYKDTEFHQSYRLKFPTQHIIQIYFDAIDRKLFFEIDLHCSEIHINHICNADHYRGLFKSACTGDRARFYLNWRVRGPCKNYSMKTFYEKRDNFSLKD